MQSSVSPARQRMKYVNDHNALTQLTQFTFCSSGRNVQVCLNYKTLVQGIELFEKIAICAAENKSAMQK